MTIYNKSGKKILWPKKTKISKDKLDSILVKQKSLKIRLDCSNKTFLSWNKYRKKYIIKSLLDEKC